MELRQRRSVHGAVRGDDVDQGQRVTLADLVVGGVVGGRDFERAGAEIRLHRCVFNDGHDAVGERENDVAAHQVLIPRVTRRHRHTGVAEHRFRTHRGHHDEVAAFDRVA